MSKVYTLESNELIDRVIEENEIFHPLREFNVRFALVYVLNVSRDGQTLPAFKPLPYRVKINSAKERCVKRVDVEIHVDEAYLTAADDEEREAVVFGALNQLEIKYNDGIPVFQDDGVVKLSLRHPDMLFMGFSECAEKYKDKSPERKIFKELTTEFNNILF